MYTLTTSSATPWRITLSKYLKTLHLRYLFRGTPLLTYDRSNNVHAAVGGDLADPRTSTNDPVFFLHHNNIERWWRIWQQENPELAHDYSGNRIPGRRDNVATPNDIMTFYGLFPDTPVWQAFDIEGGMNGAWVSR